MALANTSTLSSKSLCSDMHSLSHQPHHQPAALSLVTNKTHRRPRPISAVHAAEPAKAPATAVAAKPAALAAGKWAVDSWKGKKALQLPEYPDAKELESVLQTIESFPPIVFAGEARSLEEKIGDAAMGNAFLLQGGDCAESFKEFSGNNIRDTFRVLLQMGVVLMFGGQMPVIKVIISFVLAIRVVIVV